MSADVSNMSPDTKTLRMRERAEQRRADADAAARRARENREYETQLANERDAARRKAKQDRRIARRQRRKARKDAAHARRAHRWTVLKAALPVVGRRVLLIGPIVFPMAVAWVGQIGFAQKVMGWQLWAAIGFAAAQELSTAYVARLAWQAQRDGDRAILLRAMTWVLAGIAATMNYWHAAPDWQPNGVAVSYGLMSVLGIVLWELYTMVQHRSHDRSAGRRAHPRPAIGLVFALWHPRIWLAAISACVADQTIVTREAAVAAGRAAVVDRTNGRHRRQLARLATKAVRKAGKNSDAPTAAVEALAALAVEWQQPLPAAVAAVVDPQVMPVVASVAEEAAVARAREMLSGGNSGLGAGTGGGVALADPPPSRPTQPPESDDSFLAQLQRAVSHANTETEPGEGADSPESPEGESGESPKAKRVSRRPRRHRTEVTQDGDSPQPRRTGSSDSANESLIEQAHQHPGDAEARMALLWHLSGGTASGRQLARAGDVSAATGIRRAAEWRARPPADPRTQH